MLHAARDRPEARPHGTSTLDAQNAGVPRSTLRETPLDVSRMLYMLYQDVEQQISRADFKAQITLGSATLLAALAVNLGLGFATLGLDRMVTLEWIALVCYGICALCVCGAIGFAVSAAYPGSIGKGRKPPADPNLYFSAHIIQLEADDYVARFIGQSMEQLKESVVRQIRIKSLVLEAKLAFVRRGLGALVASVFWWAAGHGALLVAYGRLIGH